MSYFCEIKGKIETKEPFPEDILHGFLGPGLGYGVSAEFAGSPPGGGGWWTEMIFSGGDLARYDEEALISGLKTLDSAYSVENAELEFFGEDHEKWKIIYDNGHWHSCQAEEYYRRPGAPSYEELLKLYDNPVLQAFIRENNLDGKNSNNGKNPGMTPKTTTVADVLYRKGLKTAITTMREGDMDTRDIADVLKCNPDMIRELYDLDNATVKELFINAVTWLRGSGESINEILEYTNLSAAQFLYLGLCVDSNEVLFCEMLVIRDSGLTNMFDTERVKELAKNRGYRKLKSFIDEHKGDGAWVTFITTGVLPGETKDESCETKDELEEEIER